MWGGGSETRTETLTARSRQRWKQRKATRNPIRISSSHRFTCIKSFKREKIQNTLLPPPLLCSSGEGPAGGCVPISFRNFLRGCMRVECDQRNQLDLSDFVFRYPRSLTTRTFNVQHRNVDTHAPSHCPPCYEAMGQTLENSNPNYIERHFPHDQHR